MRWRAMSSAEPAPAPLIAHVVPPWGAMQAHREDELEDEANQNDGIDMPRKVMGVAMLSNTLPLWMAL